MQSDFDFTESSRNLKIPKCIAYLRSWHLAGHDGIRLGPRFGHSTAGECECENLLFCVVLLSNELQKKKTIERKAKVFFSETNATVFEKQIVVVCQWEVLISKSFSSLQN